MEEITLLKENIEFIVLILTIVGAFIWVKIESRSDYKSIDAKLDNLIKEIHDWNMNFQGRLSSLEERRKGK